MPFETSSVTVNERVEMLNGFYRHHAAIPAARSAATERENPAGAPGTAAAAAYRLGEDTARIDVPGTDFTRYDNFNFIAVAATRA